MQYDFAEIYPIFAALWQNNEPGSAGPINMGGWRETYYKIRTLDDKPSGYYICLNCRWEGCSPMVDMNCLVCEKKNGRPIGPVALHASWSEILGMEIVVNTEVRITPQELAAGLLWEITYYGGSEKMVKANIEKRFSCNGSSPRD